MPLADDPLFAAILAMDSYDRGVDAGLIVSGNGVGAATRINVSLPDGSPDAGFFAQAYSWNNETNYGDSALNYRRQGSPPLRASVHACPARTSDRTAAQTRQAGTEAGREGVS